MTIKEPGIEKFIWGMEMIRMGNLIGRLGLLLLLGMAIGVLVVELRRLGKLRYRLKSGDSDAAFIILTAAMLMVALIACLVGFAKVFCETFLGG